MTNDPSALAGLVAREIRVGERDGAPTRATVATRLYRTHQADLWDAITNIERIPRWFLPIGGELALGGRYRLEGNASGTIETCDEPTSFSVTWEFGDSLSWLTVVLSPADGGTELELKHESPLDPSFWAQYGPGATGLGWDLALMGLGWHVEDGRRFGPEDESAFAASPEGTAFIANAGAAWGEAAAASGDDRDAAVEAAQRSVAFYSPAAQDGD